MFEDGRGYQRLAIDKKKKNIPSLYCFNLLHEGLVMLKKMAEEFQLHEKLCFIDKTPFSEQDYTSLESPFIYNQKIKNAVAALEEKLPTFAVMDKGIREEEQLCLLIERGSFWGMGYLPANTAFSSTDEVKSYLNPYADNDTIRNSIYSFVEKNPDKRISLVSPSLVIRN